MFSEENEDALQRLRSGGDDLTSPRGIDFTVVFPDRVSATKFADHLFADYRVFIEESNSVEALPWDVRITRRMIPKNEEITAFEALLESIAEPLGGRNDGWGCFGQ